MDIVFATNNKHKVEEAQAILGDLFHLITLGDLQFFEDIPETAPTLQGNAFMKAQHVWDKIHRPCFADDTGLEVDALNGAPGVYSARYAGVEHNPTKNTIKLLKEMTGARDRKARFRTVTALIIDGDTFYFEGVLEGKITKSPHGEMGFGYDPVFIPAGYDRTLAELTPEEKNAISHRGQSLRKLSEFLGNNLQ